MAQASKLAIGAGAALAGGFIGGWFQRQRAARQVEPVASDAPAPREDVVIPEQQAHFLMEQREQAYAAFGEAVYAMVDLAEQSGRYGGPSRDALGRANAAIRKTLMLVKIVGSEGQIALAEQISTVTGSRHLTPDDVQALRELRDQFFAQARRELQSTDLTATSVRQPGPRADTERERRPTEHGLVQSGAESEPS
jgi:hypothetical protein